MNKGEKKNTHAGVRTLATTAFQYRRLKTWDPKPLDDMGQNNLIRNKTSTFDIYSTCLDVTLGGRDG